MHVIIIPPHRILVSIRARSLCNLKGTYHFHKIVIIAVYSYSSTMMNHCVFIAKGTTMHESLTLQDSVIAVRRKHPFELHPLMLAPPVSFLRAATASQPLISFCERCVWHAVLRPGEDDTLALAFA